MKIASIVGARPQFIKCAQLSKELRKSHQEIIIHTGQHYDYEMDKVFFDELEIPQPDYNLGVGSGTHGVQTGKILIGLDPILSDEKPDCVIVYGDTNTTLAGALAAYKLHYPCAHVESGMREYIRRAEEMNRKIADHCSDFLFCPLKRAADNLIREGIGEERIFFTGDVTYDAYIANSKIADKCNILSKLRISPENYIVLTLHRAETVDIYEKLCEIIDALTEIKETIIFPAHPRTKRRLVEFGLIEKLEKPGNIYILEPVGYFEFLKLLKHSKLVITDSGGVVKEAFYAKKPSVSLDHTRGHEEVFREIFDLTYILTGTTKEGILSAYDKMINRTLPTIENNPFGDGHAAEKIVEILSREFGDK